MFHNHFLFSIENLVHWIAMRIYRLGGNIFWTLSFNLTGYIVWKTNSHSFAKKAKKENSITLVKQFICSVHNYNFIAFQKLSSKMNLQKVLLLCCHNILTLVPANYCKSCSIHSSVTQGTVRVHTSMYFLLLS